MKRLRIEVEFIIHNEEQVGGWIKEFGLTWSDLLEELFQMYNAGDGGKPLYLFEMWAEERYKEYSWGEYGDGGVYEQKAGPVRWDVVDADYELI